MLARVARRCARRRASTGFTVQRMVQRPLAQELIVGASVDPLFGPVLLFGQGGTAVEVIADRAIALPPLNRVLARDLVSRTRVARLLAGYRDHPPARLDAVFDVLIALRRCWPTCRSSPSSTSIRCWADHEGVIALDARLRLIRGDLRGRRRASRSRPIRPSWRRRSTGTASRSSLRPIRPEDEPQHRAFVERLRPRTCACASSTRAASCRAASWRV